MGLGERQLSFGEVNGLYVRSGPKAEVRTGLTSLGETAVQRSSEGRPRVSEAPLWTPPRRMRLATAAQSWLLVADNMVVPTRGRRILADTATEMNFGPSVAVQPVAGKMVVKITRAWEAA